MFALLGALLALTLAPALYAQSGRNKQPVRPSTSGTTRPKRASTNSDSQEQKPAPATTPSGRVPSGVVVMDEAPPPAPTPKPVADSSAGEEVGAEDVVKITSNLVTVPASVIDAQGRAVIDLKLEDFELRVDGQPRPISDLSRSEVPVTLALLFDNSESLSAARELEKQAAIKFFRTVIRPIDRAAIYSVATDVDLVQPLTNNVPALVHTIDRFGKPEGATKLLDAIAEAATYLRPYPGRKVIIIVSDGEDTLSDLEFDAVLRRTLVSDCQVYAVQTKQIEYAMLTGEARNANIQALAAERRLQDLTSHTGGTVYTPMVSGDLDAAFAQISAELSQQYILSYYPSDDHSDGRFRTISVRVATRPNMRVRARRGYYPRRPNDNFSNSNTQPPGMSEPTINQNSPAGQPGTARRMSPPTDSLPALSSSGMPVRGAGSISGRSRRVGPSDAGDEQEPVSTVKTASPVGEPLVRGNASAARGSETMQSSPKSGPGSAPSTSAPANSPAGSSAAKSAPPASEAADSSQRQEAKSDRDVIFSGGVLNGRAISLPRPEYPPNARSTHAEGLVTVEVLLDEEGRVVSAKAVDGIAMLRPAAVAAARLARFSPTLLSGKPVKVSGMIIYKFTLAQ